MFDCFALSLVDVRVVLHIFLQLTLVMHPSPSQVKPGVSCMWTLLSLRPKLGSWLNTCSIRSHLGAASHRGTLIDSFIACSSQAEAQNVWA